VLLRGAWAAGRSCNGALRFCRLTAGGDGYPREAAVQLAPLNVWSWPIPAPGKGFNSILAQANALVAEVLRLAAEVGLNG
jgi:hypothetical protein